MGTGITSPGLTRLAQHATRPSCLPRALSPCRSGAGNPQPRCFNPMGTCPQACPVLSEASLLGDPRLPTEPWTSDVKPAQASLRRSLTSKLGSFSWGQSRASNRIHRKGSPRRSRPGPKGREGKGFWKRRNGAGEGVEQIQDPGETVMNPPPLPLPHHPPLR